jgi:superfamily I DNA/RNA helicase
VVLDINYRNTTEIVEFARRLVAQDEYADIEGSSARGDVPTSVPRTGPKPCVAWCHDWTTVAFAMESRIHLAASEIGTSFGDVAVLCATNRSVDRVTKHLEGAGIPTVSLLAYTGKPVDAVKVGTIKRAKGLEFKHVLIPDIHRDQTGSTAPEDDADRERWTLSRRELYVAMTRARDGLWVAIEDPQRII